MAKRQLYPLKIDKWDSRFFKTPIARLTISGKTKDLFLYEMLSRLMLRAINAKIRYLVAKLEDPGLFSERILKRLGMKERGKSVDLKFSYNGKKPREFFSKYNIGILEKPDLDKVKDIASDAFRRSYFYKCAFAKRSVIDRYHAKWVENLSRDKNTVIFTAKKDSEVAGFVILRADKDDRSGRIILIAVDKRHRSKGVGRSLMSKCVKWADGRVEDIFVKTQQDNSAAIRLYKRIGFKPVSYDKIFCKKIASL